MDPVPDTNLQLNRMMNQRYSSLLLALAMGGTAVLAQNSCSTALAISAGTHVITINDGPEAPVPICATGSAVPTGAEWYSYTPTEDASLVITSDLAANTGRDTRVSVYTGTCGNLTCYAGDDDNGSGYLSNALMNVTANVTYIIAWDNGWESDGFTFQLIEGEPFVEAVSFTNTTVVVGGTVRGALDMNNDGRDDVLAVSSTNEGYSLGVTINYQQANGTLVPQTYELDSLNNTPSWSLCAGDLDNNGYNDLLIGGGSKVSLVFADDDGGGFSRDTTYAQYVFCQRSNMVDLNNDGKLDAFTCHDVQPNVYLLNNGDGTHTYFQGGLGDTPGGGNYGSIWTDFDNDGDVDMFIAKCRGGNPTISINQLHRNNGNGTFSEVAAQYNLADPMQTWSSAWGDYDNDGDMDVMVGASSFTAGGHKLMRNDGTTFTDVTAGSGFENFTGTSIEHITHDFNNDGFLDVMSGSGTILVNQGDMTFSQNPVGFDVGSVGDLDGDGFLDVINSGTAHLNTGNNNNWIRIQPVGTVSNRNAIGSRITITTASGTQIREIRSGDGFRYMSNLAANFGLGDDGEVLSVSVRFPSGIVNTIENPSINGTTTIVEDINTSVADSVKEPLVLFPVPTKDILFISGNFTRNSSMRVFDTNGKLVAQIPVATNHLSVATLPTGVYVLEVQTADGPVQRSFVKQ